MNAAQLRSWSGQEALLNTTTRPHVLWRLHTTSLASLSHLSNTISSKLKAMSNKDLDSSNGMLNERSPGPSYSTSYNRQRPAIGAFPPRKQSSVAQSIDWVGEEAIANGNSLLSSPPTTFSSARTSLAIGLLKLQQELDSGHVIAGAEYENLIQGKTTSEHRFKCQ